MKEPKNKNKKSTGSKKASSSKGKKEIRMRNFEIVNKIDDDFNIKEFEERIRAIPYIKKYAFIIHDKDYKDEAKTKKADAHYHLQCACNNTYAISTIAGWLDVNENQIERIKATFATALLYLTHLNAPEKYQYDDTEVHANFAWQKERKEAKSRIIRERQKAELITAILDGQVKEYELYGYFALKEIDSNCLVRWDRDINTAYKHRAQMVALGTDRYLTTWFVHGNSEIGKTALAKVIAEKQGKKVFVTGSGNDILDGYMGQECIIIDECRKDTFKTYDDLLKMTDKHTASRMRSRYRNKILNDVEIIIITSTKSFEELFYAPYQDEETRQVNRRISTILEASGDDVIVKQYNKETNQFHFLTKFKNPLDEYIEEKERQRRENGKTGFDESKEWFDRTFAEQDESIQNEDVQLTIDDFLCDDELEGAHESRSEPNELKNNCESE